LCFEQAGIHSIQFHFRRCLEKWDRRLALPVHAALEMCDPRRLPTKPGKALDEYNARAEWLYFNRVLPQCPNCGVPCSLHALLAHVRSCCKDCPMAVQELERRFGDTVYEPLGKEMLEQSFMDQGARRESVNAQSHGSKASPAARTVSARTRGSRNGRSTAAPGIYADGNPKHSRRQPRVETARSGAASVSSRGAWRG